MSEKKHSIHSQCYRGNLNQAECSYVPRARAPRTASIDVPEPIKRVYFRNVEPPSPLTIHLAGTQRRDVINIEKQYSGSDHPGAVHTS